MESVSRREFAFLRGFQVTPLSWGQGSHLENRWPKSSCHCLIASRCVNRKCSQQLRMDRFRRSPKNPFPQHIKAQGRSSSLQQQGVLTSGKELERRGWGSRGWGPEHRGLILSSCRGVHVTGKEAGGMIALYTEPSRSWLCKTQSLLPGSNAF